MNATNIRGRSNVRGLSCALMLAGLVVTNTVAAAELGRLFFDAGQRAEIEKRRLVGLKNDPAPTQAAPIAVQETAPQPLGTVTVNGRVSRSNGKSTTWVNGIPQHDAFASKEATRVRVQGASKSQQVPIKVGQTLDRDTRAVTDGLHGGQISIQR